MNHHRHSPSQVASPCSGICQLDQARLLCLGCFRTLDEIAAWTRLSPEEQLLILQKVASRSTSSNQPSRAPQ